MAVAGGLGVIIPPSIPFIMYGMASGASVSDLFLAGIVPGLMIGLLLMPVSYTHLIIKAELVACFVVHFRRNTVCNRASE